jgi:hypothetical protein
MIGTVWIITFTAVIILVKGNGVIHAKFRPHEIICGIVQSNNDAALRNLGNISLVIFLVIPLITLGYCYFKVFKKIREHKKNIAPSSNQNNLGTSVQEIKITWVLFAVLMGYVLTWVPFFIMILLPNISTTYLPRQAHMVVTYATASSSAVNPIIYGVLNTAFRQEYRKIFRC